MHDPNTYDIFANVGHGIRSSSPVSAAVMQEQYRTSTSFASLRNNRSITSASSYNDLNNTYMSNGSSGNDSNYPTTAADVFGLPQQQIDPHQQDSLPPKSDYSPTSLGPYGTGSALPQSQQVQISQANKPSNAFLQFANTNNNQSTLPQERSSILQPQPTYAAQPPISPANINVLTMSAPPAPLAPEEISTIFVVGFPDDMQEREFQNMFTFSQGFEAATLKIPNKDLTAYSSLTLGSLPMPLATSLPLPPPAAATTSTTTTTTARYLSSPSYPAGSSGATDPYNLVTVNSGGVVVDSPNPNPSLGSSAAAAQEPRKQIIGFAKFRTRADALEAKEVLQGRRVDVEKGAVLKAEMAKKNLHTKRGVGSLGLGVGGVGNGLGADGFGDGVIGAITGTLQPQTSSQGSSATLGPVVASSNGIQPPQQQLSQKERESATILAMGLGPGVPKRPLPPITTTTPTLKDLPSNPNSTPTSHTLSQQSSISSLSSLPSRPFPPTPAQPLPPRPSSDSSSSDESIRANEQQSNPYSSPPLHQPPILNGNGYGGGYQQQLSGRSSERSGSNSPPEQHMHPSLHNPYHNHQIHYGGMNGMGALTSPQLPSPSSSKANAADQNPPINTLYVGNLPSTSSALLEESLSALFRRCTGFRKLCFRQKNNGPMCFVEFADVPYATKALNDLYGNTVNGLVKGGIRLSYSKNPLGVRGSQTTNGPQQYPPQSNGGSFSNGIVGGGRYSYDSLLELSGQLSNISLQPQSHHNLNLPTTISIPPNTYAANYLDRAQSASYSLQAQDSYYLNHPSSPPSVSRFQLGGGMGGFAPFGGGGGNDSLGGRGMFDRRESIRDRMHTPPMGMGMGMGGLES